MTTTPLLRTPRTTAHRRPARASYDRALAYRIIDEAIVCSVGIVVDQQPYVLPMAHARRGHELILHGAAAGRVLSRAATDALCVTVTLVDGLVLARSAMHHSMNFRSVMVLGRARELTSPEDKEDALRCLIEHLVPGRAEQVRSPNSKELAATRVLALPIEEASVKVRAGDPVDDQEDLAWPCWAGQLPIRLAALAPIPAHDLDREVAVPDALVCYARPLAPRR